MIGSSSFAALCRARSRSSLAVSQVTSPHLSQTKGSLTLRAGFLLAGEFLNIRKPATIKIKRARAAKLSVFFLCDDLEVLGGMSCITNRLGQRS